MVLTWLIKGVFYKIFFLYIKMIESTYLTYHQRNREVILNRAKDYYENAKKRLREQARDKYRNLSEGDKKEKIKKENMRRIDIIICLKKRNKDYQKDYQEYQKNYCEVKKSQYNNE